MFFCSCSTFSQPSSGLFLLTVWVLKCCANVSHVTLGCFGERRIYRREREAALQEGGDIQRHIFMSRSESESVSERCRAAEEDIRLFSTKNLVQTPVSTLSYRANTQWIDIWVDSVKAVKWRLSVGAVSPKGSKRGGEWLSSSFKWGDALCQEVQTTSTSLTKYTASFSVKVICLKWQKAWWGQRRGSR